MDIDSRTLRGNWNYPTTIWFGPGRAAELPAACAALDIRRPLLVTDPGLRDLPLVREALARNAAAGYTMGVFSEVRSNPVGRNVADGVVAYRAGDHDGVVALGGGSALDAAKAIALMVGQSRPLWDFEDSGDNWKRVVADGIAPLIALPTTSGTGSEVGRVAVIGNEDTRRKVLVFHPRLQPRIVIADPALTLGLPPHITAATGMDALAHCFEAYCVPAYHPLADGIALQGMRLIRDWLTVAVQDGSNLTARCHMMAASTMGATAFQKGLGAVHSLSHPVGALYDTHHGLTNAVVMPYVMQFNRPAIASKMALLGATLGLADPSHDGVLAWLLELRSRIGIPPALSGLGVREEDLDTLAEAAFADPSTPSNPVPLDVAALRQMYADAIAGRL